LIKNDVVRKLTQNFADPLINIKVAAAGALRLLSLLLYIINSKQQTETKY
jgi:hypothetical protein